MWDRPMQVCDVSPQPCSDNFYGFPSRCHNCEVDTYYK